MLLSTGTLEYIFKSEPRYHIPYLVPYLSFEANAYIPEGIAQALKI